MPKIKTKETIKGTIKAIDKTAIAEQRIRSGYSKTKEKLEEQTSKNESSPEEYAVSKIENAQSSAIREASHKLNKEGQKAVTETKENYYKIKNKLSERESRESTYKDETHSSTMQGDSESNKAKSNNTNNSEYARENFKKSQNKKAFEEYKNNNSPKTNEAKSKIKTKEASKDIHTKQFDMAKKNAIKNAKKNSIKTTEKSIKMTERQTVATIKTAEQVRKNTERLAKETVKNTEKSLKAIRQSMEKAKKTLKASIKATIRAIKGIIAGTKALISAIIAGGWISVAVIVVIAFVGLIGSSAYGIFFSGESTGDDSLTMPMVIAEINADYDAKIEEIKNDTSYDSLDISGLKPSLNDVISIYAIKTSMDEENPQQVATLDQEKKELISEIFWGMTEISHYTETVSSGSSSDDEEEDGENDSETILHIEIASKTAEEMAEEYEFNEKQNEFLRDLVREENDILWETITTDKNSNNENVEY